MKTKFLNATLITIDEPFVINNANLLVKDNIICKISSDNILEDADRVIDCEGDILMPGFINTHAHNAMTMFRGLKDDVDLMDWLYNYIFKIEKHIAFDDVYYSALLGFLENISSGITTVYELYLIPKATFKAGKESGIRLFNCIGTNPIDDDKFLDEFMDEYTELQPQTNDLVKLSTYIHSIYTQSMEKIEMVAKLAKKYNLLSTIHLSESLEEVGECAKLNNDMSPVQYVERLGLFDNPCIISHGVHVDKDDMKILKRYDVSVASCPACNLKLGNGIAPITSYLKEGVNVCLGTDGPGSNNSIDFFREMYLLSYLQKGIMHDPKVIPAKEVLKIATINGAKALKLNDVGKLKEGYKADIIRINTKSINMQPMHDVVSNLIYSANKKDVIMTMVDGKILYENGEFTNLNIKIDEIIATMNKNIKKLLNDLKIEI